MQTTDKSELFAIGLGVVLLVGYFCWRLLLWVKTAPLKPEPWDETIEAAVHQDDAVEVCHRCFTPAPAGHWFCEHCGAAVGPYNNWMPYLHVFSEGEVLRNGLSDRMPKSIVTVAGYLLISVSSFAVFAPVYWFLLIRRWKSGKPQSDSPTPSATDA